MLDSNLPTYYFKPSHDKNRPFESPLLFTQFESDPEPRYILRHADPTSPAGKNCYAAALFDAYIADVLFGEVLVKPQWTQPTLSPDEIRRNGGVPPPPQPIIPLEFTIQLYNPDQQVVITEKPASWGGTPTYHFTMPQHTFRMPSASALDRSSSDPAVDLATPQLNFVWKRDGKLTKDLSCYMTGRTTDTRGKKKGGKEPDIAIAIFSGLRDLTIYEPNLSRVEMEDYKGLELVLLLGATVIRDIYCGQKKDCFNTGEASRKNSGPVRRKSSMPLLSLTTTPSVSPPAPQTNGNPTLPARDGPRPPPADPRTQWEIDAESARLRAQTEAEKRERLKVEEAERKRIKKMVDAEEKEMRRRQAEIDKETQRLVKRYGDQSGLLPPKPPIPQRHSAPLLSHYPAQQQPRPVQMQPYRPPPQMAPGPSLQPYGQAGPAASASSFFHGAPRPQQPQLQQPKPKKSLFSLRGLSSGNPTGPGKISKKQSV
ncbi:hypothetical protein EJ06DRAFT_533603 [Trichodelitschia bisporula]|uniref:Uncharacterized protein n=1 Tax=Trichodelitschia bisporula TaxID=703511 RepID=A0A6G1HLV7_9PEZI|nr:hypothetical protein EJ06DRAFT_533603 [Trichodelitschia bisporula]